MRKLLGEHDKQSKVRNEIIKGLTRAPTEPTDGIAPIANGFLVFVNLLYYTKRSLLMGPFACPQTCTVQPTEACSSM